MNIKSEKMNPAKKKTALLCTFVYEKSKSYLGLKEIDSKLGGLLKAYLKETDGKTGTLNIIHTHGKVPAQRILFAGLGEKKKVNYDLVRIVSGKIAQKARELGISEYSIFIPTDFELDTIPSIKAIVEGSELSLYSFDIYKKEKNKKSPDLSILIEHSGNIKDVIKRTQKICQGVIFTRDVANLPPNDCPPEQLAKFAKSLASQYKLKCIVMSKNEIRQKGLGGITAVGSGSKNEPKLIILEYNGKRGERPVVVVGKAVTFDTGGISIKPSEKMEEMKFDKCGGCTVLGIMRTVSALKLPVNVVGIMPAVENMPSGEAYRPGDIIKLYNGKTAEILNTDAEGRLILADALAYGKKNYSPKCIIDFATLTGACIVALGTNVAGIIGNDDKLISKIKQAAENTSEQVWQLPIDDDYMEMIKSDVA
ncbi:MAG: leucyl aminopeptidase family protein, partial [Nitrosopumilaceae archaeon]